LDFTNKVIKKTIAGSKSPQETLDRLRRLAEEYANILLRENDNIRLIILVGSIGRELSGEMPCGATVWEGSDIDLFWWDSDTDIDQLKKTWKENSPHWLFSFSVLKERYDEINYNSFPFNYLNWMQ